MTDKARSIAASKLAESDNENVARTYLIEAARAMIVERAGESGPEADRLRIRLNIVATVAKAIDEGTPPPNLRHVAQVRELCLEFVLVVISRGGEDLLDGPPQADDEFLAIARKVLTAQLAT